MNISHLSNEQEKIMERKELQYYKGLKVLKTLSCIAEEEPEKARGYLYLFKIFANVWQALRHPPADGQFDDEDLNEIISYCQAWSKRLPIIFPDRNITRKGHVLSFHIPEYLRKYRSHYLYYNLEQAEDTDRYRWIQIDTDRYR